MKEYPDRSDLDEYEAAHEQFKHLLVELQSQPVQGLAHGEVELLLVREGNELLRRLMQGYLDQRSGAEERREAVLGADGPARSQCRGRSRALQTLFGEVRVRRLGYSGAGAQSLFPLDAALNLPPDKYSQGLRRKIGREVAKGSFDEAIKAIAQNPGAEVPKRQTEQVARAISVDFEAYYATREAPQTDAPEATRTDTPEPGVPKADVPTLLVMSVDGKGVVMRKEDLRPATRKAAQSGQHKLKTRLSRGEKRHHKRMATVAAVYEVAPYPRTAEQIMGRDKAPKAQRPKVQHKRVWASLRQEPAEIIEQLFAEAQRRDPQHQKTWLVLLDGAEAQRRDVEAAMARYRTDGVIIQDFVHALEYLWKAVYCFHDEGTAEAEAWVLEHALALLKGKVSDVAAGMRRRATRQGLSQAARAAVDKCAEYLLKNTARFDYATALTHGWPIATGIIEGACRHLVKDRMDLTGARWSLEGAEAVLRLRALCSSGDFDPYMTFHFRQERLRNYASLPLAEEELKMAA